MTAPTQQEIDDIRNKDKQDKAYDDAMTVTEPNPAPKPKPKPKVAPKKLAHGGTVIGMHRMPDGKMMKNSDHKGMKAGGMTRGDGIAQRGKTKGRMC